ncbi:hypothetical protein BH18THE2_BH18THE2_22190 [soil metagenome]
MASRKVQKESEIHDEYFVAREDVENISEVIPKIRSEYSVSLITVTQV